MRLDWRKISRFAVGLALLAVLLLSSGMERKRSEKGPVEVSFSVESGFYDEPFYLELDGDGTIYYTLDSSTPDEYSMIYTEPLLIKDASANENVYSMITNVSLELETDYLTDNGIKPKHGYQTPKEPVDKATVVRAMCIDDLGKVSEVATAVYFVGFNEKNGYDGIKVMAITTAPRNLFDYEKGIYVLGKKLDDSIKDGKIGTSQLNNFEDWSANYKQRGIRWEKKASICCFDDDETLVFSGKYGLRVQGGWSRSYPIKGLNIFARERYGNEYLDGNRLFGIQCQLTSLNLGSGANDIKTMLKDYIVNEMAREMEVCAREYEPCAVFLDGEYWGVYWLTPRQKENYISQRYGVNQSNIVGIKVGNLEMGEEDDIHLYEEMMAFVSDNDMSQPENYTRICEMIDLKSCIEYYALEMFISNTDWPHNNRALWRTRVAALDNYSDCRWRWLLYDINAAMNLNFTEYDMISFAASRDPLFASLMDNPDFSSTIYAKMVELATDTFETQKVEAFIEDYKAKMAEPKAKEYARFYGDSRTVDDFYNDCNDIKEFFRKRNEFIIEQYAGKVA